MDRSSTRTDTLSAEQVRVHFGLSPLPVEGGHYTPTWRGGAATAAGGLRSAGSAILCLATPDYEGFFALHRLPIDEVYHFHLGDPAELLLLYPDGRSECVVLGHDILSGERVQQVVPAHVWQGLRVRDGGAWSLFGATMAPGFVPADYEGCDRETLIATYPQEAQRITQLTRTDRPHYREES